MKKLDKKQTSQVAVMGVLSAGLFGYFAKTMILPSPASAKGPAPTPPAGGATPGTTSSPAAGAAAAPGGSQTASAAGAAVIPEDVPAPSPLIRDPFVQPLSSAPPAATLPSTAPARPAAPQPRVSRLEGLSPAPFPVPSAPALPFPAMSTRPAPKAAMLPPLPVAPPWTVTGVLQSGNEHIAILRSGDARRFVRTGEYVDDQFQVTAVTRSAVVLRSGKAVFTLPLGGAKEPGAAKAGRPHAFSGFVPSAPALPTSFSAPAPAPARSAPPLLPLDMTQARPAALSIPKAKRLARAKRATQAHVAQAERAARNGMARAEHLMSARMAREEHLMSARLADADAPVPRPLPARTETLPAPRIASAALTSPVVKVADSRREWSADTYVAAPSAPLRAVLPTRMPQWHAAVHTHQPKARLAVRMRQAKATLAAFTPGSLPFGAAAPDFSLSASDGSTVTLSDLRGKVVLLNFWASWVEGSGRTLAQLSALQESLGEQGLQVVNVNSWDSAASMQSALTAHALTGPTRPIDLFDPSVSNESVAVTLYHAHDVPALYIIDRNGAVRASFTGSGPRILAAVKDALKALGLS